MEMKTKKKTKRLCIWYLIRKSSSSWVEW